jgi:uridine phosphorylase
MWLISPEQTLAAAMRSGFHEESLRIAEIAVLTFNKSIVDRMTELCGLSDARWLAAHHHPYATAEVVKRGKCDGFDVAVLVPPMGASPLGCVVEDLASCGVKGVFLVCAAWSLGPPVEAGDLIVPSYSLGLDGTSIHYGNVSEHVDSDPLLTQVLYESCKKRGARVHVGGNASCEALYRITPEMVEKFRNQGCICMENGEASTLIAVARTRGMLAGVLFQPYIELSRGWDPSWLGERYSATCRLQAEIVVDACVDLKRRGLL